MDEATAVSIDALVGEEVPENEATNLQAALSRMSQSILENTVVKASIVRRRLSLLNLGAEAGPSGLRNSCLVTLKHVPHGVAALQKWSLAWSKGTIAPQDRPDSGTLA